MARKIHCKMMQPTIPHWFGIIDELIHRQGGFRRCIVVHTWEPVIPSTSMFLRELRKFVSDIMALAVFQLTSLYPLMITTHSHTVCTCCGGFANDLEISIQHPKG